jgi:8-oxo-dGTP diphosphatase
VCIEIGVTSMTYQYEWPRPALTTDAVIFLREANDLKVLLIKRKNEPYKDYWALPGGYVEDGESLIQGAVRELKEETGITDVKLTQVAAFGDPGRDPRGWQVTVAFYGFATSDDVKAGDDAGDARWFSLRDTLPLLACDHLDIVNAALRKTEGYA